jgi:hypothetical protein
MAQPLFSNLKQVLPVGERLGFVLVGLKLAEKKGGTLNFLRLIFIYRLFPSSKLDC